MSVSPTSQKKVQPPKDISVQGLADVDVSPAIARMLEEVRFEAAGPKGDYNRVHNRHNR